MMLKDYTKTPILITGAARSGTSMVAACFYLCGAWKGNTGGPSQFNKKGMFENIPLRQSIIKPILKSLGYDPLGQYPLPPTEKVQIPVNISDRIIYEISKQGWKTDLPWMWKCAKMSLVWPIWAYAFPESKWIIVRRKKEDIIFSCTKTAFMRSYQNKKILHSLGFSDEKQGWNYWVEFHEKKFQEIINHGVNAKVVWPEKMVKADYSEIKDAIEWAGLKWNGLAVTDFIEPKLWKARR